MTTRWTVVFKAAAEKSETERPALSEIIKRYWRPLYFFARQRGLSQADAEDATQGFLAGLLDGNFLERADPAKGKFRTFLLTAWKRYLIDLHRHDAREKRGGSVATISIDSEYSEQEWLRWRSKDADPERAFLASWASTLVEETLKRLRTEYSASQRIAVYDSLIPYLTAPLSKEVYEQIANKLNVSAGASKVALHRLRQRFAQSLREVVEETVDDSNEVEAELNELFRVLVENPMLASPRAPL